MQILVLPRIDKGLNGGNTKSILPTAKTSKSVIISTSSRGRATGVSRDSSILVFLIPEFEIDDDALFFLFGALNKSTLKLSKTDLIDLNFFIQY